MFLNINVPRTKTPPRRGAGFTLVELLVVIGIIAVLISMLLPALNRARAAAVSVTCQSNLRSIGQAYTMYVQDNKGSMLPGELIRPSAADPTVRENYMYWYMALRPYVSKLSNTGDLDRVTAIWLCPADETRGGFTNAGAFLLPRYGGGPGGITPAQEATGLEQFRGRSYAINHHGTQGWFRSQTVPSNFGKISDYWIRSNNVRRHAETIIVTDFDWYRSNSNAYWLKPPWAPFGSSWSGWEESLILTAMRHPGKSLNALFLDGHVAAHPIAELRRDGSQERLWFRDYPNDWPGPGK